MTTTTIITLINNNDISLVNENEKPFFMNDNDNTLFIYYNDRNALKDHDNIPLTNNNTPFSKR